MMQMLLDPIESANQHDVFVNKLTMCLDYQDARGRRNQTTCDITTEQLPRHLDDTHGSYCIAARLNASKCLRSF